jgi:hypothetical protein
MDLLKRINQRSEHINQSYLPQMNFVLPKVLQLVDAKRSVDPLVMEQHSALPSGSSLA